MAISTLFDARKEKMVRDAKLAEIDENINNKAANERALLVTNPQIGVLNTKQGICYYVMVNDMVIKSFNISDFIS